MTPRLTTEPTTSSRSASTARACGSLPPSDLWSDLDPTYLPSGDMAFVSDRCECSLQCNEMDKDETSCNLYVMRPDGSRIRRLSVSKDGDYLPHALDDGTIGYTRWEYQERGWANVQSLWTIRPDGTGPTPCSSSTSTIPGRWRTSARFPARRSWWRLPPAITRWRPARWWSSTITRASTSRRASASSRPACCRRRAACRARPCAEGGVADHGGFYMTPWALSETTFLVSYGYGSADRSRPATPST